MRRSKQTPVAEGSKPPRATSLSTKVYQQLRADVLMGRLRPGEKLRVEALRKRFDIASSPIREALNRLLADGVVAFEDQKGFRVAPISESDLRDIVQARTAVDCAALAEGIRRRSTEWEESLVLALHRLTRAVRHVAPGTRAENAEWERLHRAFHLALIAGCGSRWLGRFSEQLLDAAERYRILAADRIPERNELEEHRGIVDACLAHDVARATQLLAQHYGTTFRVIMSSPSAPT